MADPSTGRAGETPVIIDALAARFGGTAYLAIQIARRLGLDPAVADVSVITRRDSIVAAGLKDAKGVRIVSLRRADRFELPRRLAWQALALPSLLSRGSRVLTFSGMLPRRVGVRVVSHVSNPVMFERGGAMNALRRRAVRRTATAPGTVVVVPSRHQADLLARSLGIDALVVPHGIDHARFRPSPTPGTEILYVGDLYRHKRHDLVLAAWRELPAPRPTLRFVGDDAVDRAWTQELRAQAADEPGVRFEARLPLRELVAAYHRARVVMLASEHESFALPLLEAQACGVPAIARDTPALRETGGPGTSYVTGDDPREWAAAIGALLEDEDRHRAARRRSIEHARGYDWDRTASSLRDLLLA